MLLNIRLSETLLTHQNIQLKRITKEKKILILTSVIKWLDATADFTTMELLVEKPDLLISPGQPLLPLPRETA